MLSSIVELLLKKVLNRGFSTVHSPLRKPPFEHNGT